MQIKRKFTNKAEGPYNGIEFRKTTSEIRNPDGSIVFSLKNIEVPSNWSQVACDVLAQKYFRKAGVPKKVVKIEEEMVPSWLWRSEPVLKNTEKKKNLTDYDGEDSVKQVFHRLAGTWTYWGWKGGYFDTEEDALS